jgi:hypothetical protein
VKDGARGHTGTWGSIGGGAVGYWSLGALFLFLFLDATDLQIVQRSKH